MARPRTPLSSYGVIRTVEIGADRWRARTRFRFKDGRLRQVERYAPSKAKAEAALKAALVALQPPSVSRQIRAETKLSAVGERFLRSKAERAPRTVEAYEHSMRKVILPRIGELTVAEATAGRLQDFIDTVKVENGAGSAKTAKALLSGMMGIAVRAGAVPTNPVRDLETIQAKASGAAAIPENDLPVVLEKVRADERLREVCLVDVVEFLAGTGARISEALELTWDSVDVEAHTVTIGTKTEASERTIVVPDSVTVLLATSRSQRDPVRDTNMVFPNAFGRRWDARRAAGEWRDARSRLGFPDKWTFHAFRKTVATALDKAGLTPREIAEYLGHKDPSLTMSVYMSKTVGGSRAADALDSMLKN